MTFHRAAYKPGDFPNDGRPQFAFAGRSNVGKSTLINAVLNRKAVARVSQTPGKTQAVQFYLVNEQFYLVDLPGYGYAKVPQAIRSTWDALIRSYFQTSESLRLLFVLLDVRREPTGHDLQMLEWATDSGYPTAVVLTKSDKLSSQQLAKSRVEVARELEKDPKELIPFSGVTRTGIHEIRSAIAKRI